MSTRTVGIDVAIRGQHVARMFDEHGKPVGGPLSFRTVAGELRELVRAVRSGLRKGDRVVAVLEPTSMCWYPLARWLTRAGCTVIRVKGQRVKALRRYLSEYAKTDALDAHVLGRLPAFGGPGLQPLYVPSAEQQALNRLTKQRVRYQEAISATKRRLKDLIRWAHPALEGALPDLVTTVSLAVLEQYFDPRRMRRLGAMRLARFLRQHMGGSHPTHGPFAEELASKLIAAAGEALELYRADDIDYGRLQLEVNQEVRLLRLHREHVRQLEDEIARLYTTLHPEGHLRTLPGIGDTLSASLLGVLHSWSRFGGQRRMRGFCGLFPRRNESGGTSRPGQRITLGGNNRVKRDLMLAADVARTVDPELARVYYQCMVAKGHHHRQALCAVATRLVNRIFAVWRAGRSYELRDLEGRSIDLAAAKTLIRERLQVPVEVRRSRRRSSVEAA